MHVWTCAADGDDDDETVTLLITGAVSTLEQQIGGVPQQHLQLASPAAKLRLNKLLPAQLRAAAIAAGASWPATW
jgi:hypothetical protein